MAAAHRRVLNVKMFKHGTYAQPYVVQHKPQPHAQIMRSHVQSCRFRCHAPRWDSLGQVLHLLLLIFVVPLGDSEAGHRIHVRIETEVRSGGLLVTLYQKEHIHAVAHLSTVSARSAGKELGASSSAVSAGGSDGAVLSLSHALFGCRSSQVMFGTSLQWFPFLLPLFLIAMASNPIVRASTLVAMATY